MQAAMLKLGCVPLAMCSDKPRTRGVRQRFVAGIVDVDEDQVRLNLVACQGVVDSFESSRAWRIPKREIAALQAV
jgi:hypothetical protein